MSSEEDGSLEVGAKQLPENENSKLVRILGGFHAVFSLMMYYLCLCHFEKDQLLTFSSLGILI